MQRFEAKKTQSAASKAKKIAASFPIDCKFIDGKLIVFELGSTLASGREGPEQLYKTTQHQYVLSRFKELATREKTHLHTDIENELKNLNEHFALNLDQNDFYQTSPAPQGYVVSQADQSEVCKRSVFSSENLVILNAHIMSTLMAKYCLYHHCQKTSALAKSIPKTFFATLRTLEHNKKQLDPHKVYFVKLPDATRGKGMQVFSQAEEITREKLLSNAEFASHLSDKNANIDNEIFIIQEAAIGDIAAEKKDGHFTDEKQQKPEKTRRVFVIVHGDITKSESLEVEIFFPYFRVPQSANPRKNDLYKFTLSDAESQQVKDFSRTLLTSLYDNEQQRFPLHWESMVSDFVREHANISEEERIIRLSLMTKAMEQESWTSFEKISPENIKNLTSIFRILTSSEKQAIDPAISIFFQNTLIGDIQSPLPKGCVSTDLLEVFKLHLSGLDDSAISAYLRLIDATTRVIDDLDHPLHHNFHFVNSLFSLADNRQNFQYLTCEIPNFNPAKEKIITNIGGYVRHIDINNNATIDLTLAELIKLNRRDLNNLEIGSEVIQFKAEDKQVLEKIKFLNGDKAIAVEFNEERKAILVTCPKNRIPIVEKVSDQKKWDQLQSDLKLFEERNSKSYRALVAIQKRVHAKYQKLKKDKSSTKENPHTLKA